MRFISLRRLAASCACALALLPAIPAGAQDAPAPLTLMRLGYRENGEPVEVKVPAEAGAAASPLRGKALPMVAILPGAIPAVTVQPVDVVVDFYHGPATIGGDLLCSIRVRYFRDAGGRFVPRYQIHSDPVVFRAPGGRWVPIESLCANASLLKFRAPKGAARDDFYSTFEFGLSDRALRIDSWVVR
jgi:hypothetical protein